MKLSDYVAKFIAGLGTRHVFAIQGGASAHLIHSLAQTPSITCVYHQHEQASAMAADAYSRVSENIGVAIATSGPGATNLITGCCCAYYDSIPVIYITGQVASFRSKADTGIRQLGFQETDTVEMFKYICKYAVFLEKPERIKYELQKALYLARSGRPGPVLIDIPDDFQRVDIEPENIESFVPEQKKIDNTELIKQAKQCIELINRARRPVIILGWGTRLSGAEEELRCLLDILKIPVILTWAMMDFLPVNSPFLVGSFGLHGTRYGNFAVQNADFIFAIGSRLDTHLTGTPVTSFAREAKKVIVDVDITELNKFKKMGLDAELLINADAKKFIQILIDLKNRFNLPNILFWNNKIIDWKKKYPVCTSEYYEEENVNPYVFVRLLSRKLAGGEVIFVDTGCTIAWMLQAFEFKEGQRLFSAFNNTPMGYALPASTGASFALDKKTIICVTGDGGLQMNIQELVTVARHQLPVKIFLINNHAYGMIQQTQDQWFNSQYEGSSTEGGLAFPDFLRVAAAYGIKTFSINKNSELQGVIEKVIKYKGPVFCNVEIPSSHRVKPQVVFGRPIEDGEPLLPRDEFFKQMIVKPAEASLAGENDAD